MIRDYSQSLKYIEAILINEKDVIANLANVVAILKEHYDFFWVGFYRVIDQDLVLGPFQGTVACTRIARGRGVCGTALSTGKVQLVPDVHKFEGHIACSAQSKSEVVIPLKDAHNNVVMVLDVDSDRLDDFDTNDVAGLSSVASLLERSLNLTS